jgi:hypothetical protein
MKQLSDEKRKSMAKPLNNVFPEINKILQKHGMEDYIIHKLTLMGRGNQLKCKPGYHVETYCDHFGTCYPICVKDIPENV